MNSDQIYSLLRNLRVSLATTLSLSWWTQEHSVRTMYYLLYILIVNKIKNKIPGRRSKIFWRNWNYHRTPLLHRWYCIVISHNSYGKACPNIRALNLKNCGPCKGFVRISAIIFSVGQWTNVNVPSSRNCLTKKCRKAICLVRSLVDLPFLTKCIAASLSC